MHQYLYLLASLNAEVIHKRDEYPVEIRLEDIQL